MRFLLYKRTRVTKKRHLSDIGERKMKTFVQTIALLIIAVLSVFLFPDRLLSVAYSKPLDDQAPAVPLYAPTTDIWYEFLESFSFRDYPYALKLIDSLIKNQPDSLEYQIYRARCLSAMGKTDEALSIYDNLAQKYNDKDEQSAILSEKAVVFVQKNKNKNALELIQSIDKDNPQTSLRYMTCKAIVLIANDQHDKALELLTNSIIKKGFGLRYDYLNNAFLYVELCCLAGHYDEALHMADQLINVDSKYGRFWLVRAYLNMKLHPDNVLITLERADKCKDEPVIRGEILLLKVYYYTQIEQNYSQAIEYLQKLMDIKCQWNDFNKNTCLTFLYIMTEQYDKAGITIKKLDSLAKTDEEQYEVFCYKLYLAHINKDGKEIQQLLENNKKLCQYCEKMNNGKMLKVFRMAAKAYQQPSDNELAQLVSDFMADFKVPRKEIPLTVFFYSFDWDKSL